MQDLRQTKEYAKYMRSLGWKSEKVGKDNVFIRKLPIVGVVAKLQRPGSNADPKTILGFIKDKNISVFYFEPSIPNSSFFIPEFNEARSTFLPSTTIRFDLTKSGKQLLANMKQKTRYNIKIAEKNEVVVKKSTNIEAFIKLWGSSAWKRGSLPQSKEIKTLWESFGDNAALLLAHTSTFDKPIAGLLLVSSNDTMFYMYAASTSEGKKLFAPTLLVWEAIKLAKKKRLKIFDFEGIYDERYSSTKSWRGFTKFKKGFGGKIVEFPKTLVVSKGFVGKIFA